MERIFRSVLTVLALTLFWAGTTLAQPPQNPPPAKGQPPAKEQPPKGTPGIQTGYKVHLEYTLTDDKGKLIESNKGKDPLIYTQGQQQIIPGLEKALNGMHVGESKRVVVSPEEGYGPVNPNAVAEIPKEQIPGDALKVGAELVARTKTGQDVPVRIKEVKDKTVVLDLNHPLAGKTLVFNVKVLNILASKAK